MSREKLDKWAQLAGKFTDFPVFQYWDFNTKEFKPRALNNLSIRFNETLGRFISDKKSLDELRGLDKEDLLKSLAREVVYSARYALFGNASFEAGGPNSYAGGDDSIQEQFVCWAKGITKEEYRNEGSWQAYSPELYTGEPLLEWVEGSEVYKYLLKKLKI